MDESSRRTMQMEKRTVCGGDSHLSGKVGKRGILSLAQ